MDIINRYNRNEFFSQDSIHFDSSLKYTTPGGRTVYGGGGIMPDIFIPLDTLGITPYYNKVWNMNVLYRYTLDFTDRHRKDIDAIDDQIVKLLEQRSQLAVDVAKYKKEHNMQVMQQGREQFILDRVKNGEADYHFIEIMCCPGGCVNGGGQPIQPNSVRQTVDIKAKRAAALYAYDAGNVRRKSHESPVVKAL